MKIITSLRLTTLPVASTLCCVLALVLATTVSSEAPKNTSALKAKEAIQMFDIGLGPRSLNVQLGRDTQSRYLGPSALQQAIQSAQVQPRSMISDDFNGDGMGDLVIGYANNGAGVLGMRQGNLQAIAPSDPGVFQAITEGRYPSPFLPEVKLYPLPEAPDFLQFGDFNSDGYADVMTAARGGQSMYFLAGDGRGNLSDAQAIAVSGLITEMRAATQQLGTFTQLAVGLFVPGGAQLAVYNKKEDLDGGPESHSMAGEVTSLAFDQLDGDGIIDLAAATSNEVVVIHGRSVQPIASENSGAKSTSESMAAKPAFIERQSAPFTIRGLATGNFAFDRNHQREIALLSDEGTVYLSVRGTPDTRPFTKAEKEAIAKLRRSFAQDKIDMETLTAEMNKFVRSNRATGWNVAETMRGTSAYTGTGKALFQRSNASRGSLDELLIGDGIKNTVKPIKSEREAAKLKDESTQLSSDSEAVSVQGAPIAAVSMRLGVGPQSGMVLLGSDSEDAIIVINVSTMFTVNSTADLPDSVPTAANGVCQASNGLCTLRAAIMQSNHTGGENTIMVPDGTYTLTLGPPDDEANTGGATEQSGDLDIFSWDQFDGSPILNSVSIVGGTRDGCIIQMGTLSPTLGTNVPNNKERILEVNDVVTIGFQNRINVTLTNLTMQNGHSPTSSGTFLEGGAIYFDGSDSDNTNQGLLTLTNVKLSANTSAGQGGGVWAGFGSLTINSSSIVRANIATNQSGGGVAWTGGNTVENQALNISNSTIGGALVADGNTANDATFGAPGGVDARGGLSVTISGSTIQNNVANVNTGTIGGGGIQINSPTVAISNTTISNNKSKSNGGGLWSSARNAVTNASSTITLTTVNITGNQADSDNLEDPGPGTTFGDGGGIFNFFGSMIIQTNSHIDGNSAHNGGGIFAGWTGIGADPTAGLTVGNSTIGQAGAGNGNTARNNGGSIAINPVGATLFNPINLNTLTFTNNTANSDSSGGGDGGAIFVGAGQLTSLNGCTIDGNIANSGTGDGIRQTGGTITGAGTINVNGADSISLSGGTFTSTSGSLNLTGNLLNTGGNFVHNSGTVSFNGSSAQSIGGTTPIAFNNLIINNSSGVSTNTASTASTGTLTLTNGALAPNAAQTFTINGPVAFTSGTFNANATSTVNYAKSSNTQNIAPGNYGNLTFSNFTKQLPASTIKIAGTFTTGAAGGHTVTGSTVEFNGGSAQTLPSNFTTYNNLTLNNTAGVTGFAGLIVQSLLRVQAGTFTSSSTYNNVQIDLGATLAGTNATTINVSGNWTNNGTFTPNGNTVNFNGGAGQVLSGSPTSQIFNHFTINKAGGALSTSGGTTSLDINGNLTLTAGTFTAPAAITLAGNFSQATGTTFTPGSGTVTFDGSGAQSISGTLANKAFFNFAVNKGGGSTLSAAASTTALDINGDVTLTAGIFSAATATGITVAGNWTNNSGTTAFNGGTGTVTLDGPSGQSIGGSAATTFNALTLSSAGTGTVLGQSATVNGTLTLNNNLTTGANVLIQPSTAPASVAGLFDVIGSVRRTGSPLPSAVGLTFGNQNNIINFTAAGTRPSEVTITLVKTAPATFTSAVQRTYSISQTGGTGFSATLRLRYLEGELNGNVESQLDLWRFDGANFVDEQQTARDTVNNWVEKSGVTAFSDWTFATHVNQAPSIAPNPAATLVNTQTSAIVLDRQTVDAAFVTHFKITGITNGTLFQNNGTTQINNNDFITYAEGNAGLKFTAALNSLAQGSFNVQASSDATGTGLSPTTTALINVSQGTTSTTITADTPDPSTVGQVVPINFTVAVLTGMGTPTGDVVITVNDGSGNTCTGTVAAGTCNLTLTTAGLKTLTATYAGDTLFVGSFDTEDHEVVGPPDAVDDNYSTFKNTPLNIAAPGVLTNDTGSPSVSSVGSCADVTTPFENCATTAGGLVTVNADGSFSYTPLTDFVGADSFTYTATNGGGNDTATVNITVSDAFFINEILFDPPGTDAPNEYIEFRGPASAAIPAGTYLVAIEGDSAENPGDIQTIINLSGLTFGSNGFLVLLQNANTYTTTAGANVVTSTTTGFGGLPGGIFTADGGATDLEDSSVTFLVIQTGTAPTLTDDIDSNDDGARDGAVFAGWSVIDSIGALNAGANVRGYGAYHYRNTAGTGTTTGAETIVGFIPSYVGRSGDTTGSTAADWVASGALGGAAPNWTLSATETEPIAFANQPLNHIGTTNFDVSPPTVQSITRVDANPTNAASVDFLVTFSESVTGVDTTDFTLTTTGGIAGASVTGVTGSGATRTVSVNTGTGDGTIRLDVTDDDTILDGSNNPLGGTGAGNGNFTAGEVYTIDKSGPTVTINQASGQADPTSTSPINFTVVFNEAVANFVTGDVNFSGAGATTATVTETAPNDGTTYNVAITGMNASGVVTASLLAGVASDALGNLSQASSSTDNTVTFNFVANNAPVLDNTGNMSLTSINEDVPNAGNPGTSVGDIIASAGGDRITDADAGAFEGIAVTAVDNTSGTWEFSINNGTNWTAFGSPDATTARLLAADVNTRVRFVPNANFNGTVATGITFRAWDQSSGTNGNTADTSTNGGSTAFSTATETASIIVAPVADTPSVTNASTNEDTQTTSGLVISRNAADGAEVTHFKITGITNGTLFQNDGVTAIANNEFITFAQGNAGLRFTPTANSTASGSFTVQAATGSIDATLGGGTATATITVTAVNDQPTLDAITPNPLNLLEDAGLQNINLSGISAGGGETQTLVVTANSNNTSLIPNPTVSYTSPNATGSISFTPVANANGTAEITVTVDDNSGGTETVSRTFTVNVDAVNDAPTANAQSVNTNEDTPVGITLSGSDVETAAGSLTFTVTVQPTNGVLSGTPPNLTYTPNADFNGADSFKFTVTDTGDGASPALTSTEAIVSITVDAVNDAPVNTVPGAQSTATNTPLTFSAGNSNLISIADIDAGTNPVQVTLTATNGTFSLSGTSGLVFSVGDGTADATMTFTGTITNINNALNGLVFTPTAGFNGAASLQIITNDQGNTGSGGAQSDTDTVNITVSAGGTLQFSAATYTVAENAGPATITITRTGGSAGTTTVDFATSNGTAGAGDYTTVSQTVTFVDGDTSETVNIPITNDSVNEPDETVNLTLSNAGGSGALGTPAIAVLTIENDDQPTFSFAVNSYNVGEAAPSLTVTVNRTGDPNVAATVDVATNDFMAASCSTVSGNASAKCDYATAGGRLRFGVGQTSKTMVLSIVDDVFVDGDETLTMALSNPSGGSALGTPSTTTITIHDNDTNPNADNPFLQNPFFVRQQYLDFLLREPDTAGFNDWLNVLNNCQPNQGFLGSNPACDRVHVSSGFFRSTEFGERGYWIYRFFEGALGRRPLFAEFTPQMRRVSGLKPQADLDLDEADFIVDFMQLPEFTTHYAGLTTAANAAQFIAALEQKSGVTLPATVPPTLPGQPTQYGRQELINLMQNGTLSPAQTLRAFVEQRVVWDAFFFKGFVTMEYFGYLRRDPDTAGYNDWLDVLTNGQPAQGIPPGDFRHLVFGFVYSVEYRERFGQP